MSFTRVRYQDDDNDDQGLFTNRSTMMANFEEWIKMATDNKINSKNSWNFALIDYFHDLNVLRDSENNINFQKASATLDGCVKIYSSRVDSVMTETGKLLSGLAQKKHDNKLGLSDNDGNHGTNERDDQEEGTEDGIYIDPATGLPVANDTDAQSKRRVYNRILETTLVDFDSIRLKELDKELNIDPLFKKALVDFDEGGAKSLLLNTLNIDSSARVIFDTAIKDDEINNKSEEDLNNKGRKEAGSLEKEAEDSNNDEVDESGESRNVPKSEDFENNSVMIEDEILSLGIDFIKFSEISRCEASSSIPELRAVVEDISKAKNFIDTVNGKFDNFLSEQELQEAVPEAGLDDINSDSAALQDEYSYMSQKEENDEQDESIKGADNPGQTGLLASNETSSASGNDGTMSGLFELDLMAYFDESLKRTWRGREHWKVRNLKNNNMFAAGATNSDKSNSLQSINKGDKESTDNDTALKKKKKQTEIDFFALDEGLEETIFAPRKRSNIDLPVRLRKNDSHYLLPDDYQFSTQKIKRLFIKPEQSMSLFNRRHRLDPLPSILEKERLNTPDEALTIADEQFWAENYERKEKEEEEGSKEALQEDIKNGPLDNPFEEEDVGVDFNQAFEDDSLDHYSTDDPGKQPIEDNKVNYSRVSKKVDVRKLKSNLWKSIKTLVGKEKSTGEYETGQNVIVKIKFSEIAGEMSKMYSDEARKDISTSFCFICLLHLANEYGLQIINTENYEDLIVAYDMEIISEIDVE